MFPDLQRLLMRGVIAVRPHDDRIRKRVFSLLESAGLHVDVVIVEGTPDDVAVRRVLGSPTRLLLVPFHAHRDSDRQAVDGFTFIAMLERQAQGTRYQILMPVSAFGAAAVSMAEAKGTLGDNVLVLHESEFDGPDTVESIRTHMA